MSDVKKMKYVSKELKTNEKYMKYEVGANISYDVSFRELIILERNVQLYFVNGLIDDMTVVHILRQLIEANDNEKAKANFEKAYLMAKTESEKQLIKQKMKNL